MTWPWRRPPRGYLIVNVDDYHALVLDAAKARHPARPAPVPAPVPPEPGDAWAALAVAVSLVTARVGRLPVDLDQLAAGVAPGPLVRVLAGLAAAALRELTADQGASLLADLGLLAARDPEAGDD